MRRFGHHHVRLHVGRERHHGRFGARDRAEQLHDEIRQAVAVAVQRRDDQRVAGGRDEQRVGGVDELRLVGDVGIAGRKFRRAAPVRGRPLAVQQARFGEDEGA